MVENKKREKRKTVSHKRIRQVRKNSRRVFLDPATPSAASIVRVVIITLLLLAIFDFARNILYLLEHLFFLIVLSVFFGYLINPLVKLIRRPFKDRNAIRFMPRSLAIIIAYAIVFSVLGIGISNIAPRVTNQAQQFAASLPEYASSIQKELNSMGTRYRRYRVPISVQEEISKRAAVIAEGVGSRITAFLLSAATYLPWLILVPVLAFFFLKDVHLFRLSLIRIFPQGRWRVRVESILNDVNVTLAAYTRAQLISCFIIGFLCTIIFWTLGVKYALLLGILAGIFEFVPLIGPFALAVIAVSVAGFSGSPWLALWTAIGLAILRLTHDYITYPRIVREGIHLHPLAIILSVLAGEQVAGIPGVFLSIPIVALLTVLYKHFLDHTGNKGLFYEWLQPETPNDKIIKEKIVVKGKG